MQVVHERCAGLDVHKKTVVASVLSPEGQETRTFGTMTRDLLLLADWLTERGVTHVAMESTGVYWKPVYNLLEDQFTLLVVNAHHLRHGLVRGSFIPSRPQRELRELTRARRSLIQQRSQVANRIQKVLEGANIKLASVATDVGGVSGRAMLEAMVAGTEDPQVLAEMARGTLRKKTQALEDALEGLVGPHQRLLLGTHLRQLDFLDGGIARVDEEGAARLRPFEQVLERGDAIPGIGG